MTKLALTNFSMISARMANGFYQGSFPLIELNTQNYAANEHFKQWLESLGISNEICGKMEALDDKSLADVEHIKTLMRELFAAYRVEHPRKEAPIKSIPRRRATNKADPDESGDKPEKAKKASSGWITVILSLLSGLFQKFMGLSNVGKVVTLIVIFAVLSQMGGPKNPPSAEPEKPQDAAAATEAPLDPFAVIDGQATQTAAAVASPIPGTTLTFEQRKQKLVNMKTTINFCSPVEAGQTVGQATARSGPDIEDDEDTPINNGTSVTILDVVESNFYDFKGKAGCGSHLRVKVQTDAGQISWVHGSTVEGVAE